MKSIKTLVILAVAASAASVSFAASETATPPIPVPKNAAAIQETAAITAKDKATSSVKLSTKKEKVKHAKMTSVKKHKTNALHAPVRSTK